MLGCGSSGGVPRVGGDWGACDPNNPKNRRRRSSILLEYWEGDVMPTEDERTIVLVDTSPDLREQLLDANTQHIDAVIYTHEHGDQTNGVDDLRAIAYRKRKQIPVYMDQRTKDNLMPRFGYCFEQQEGQIHPSILKFEHLITPRKKFQISGAGGTVNVEAFEVGHGPNNALGFRFFDTIFYSPDVHTVSQDTLEALSNLDIWIVDALRYHSHPTHAHADQALIWGAQTRTKQLIFTNLHIDMDYDTFKAELPGNQLIAYDNMSFIHTYA